MKGRFKMSKKIFFGSLVALVFFFFSFQSAVLAASSEDDVEKIMKDCAGRYEFDIQGQIMVVEFWIEEGKFLGAPEGQDYAEIDHVEGMRFETYAPDGNLYELEFVRDEDGKVVKCLMTVQGMEVEGIRIDD
jgi:hypothetical protein